MGYEDRRVLAQELQAGDRLYLIDNQQGALAGPYDITETRPSRGSQFRMITMLVHGEQVTYGYASHEEVQAQIKDRVEPAPAAEPHKGKVKVVHLDWSSTSSIRTACGRFMKPGEPAPWTDLDRVTCQRCRKSSIFKQAMVRALTAAKQEQDG